MYSVLIVDDEEPVLESYSYMVASCGDELAVCGTARSGSEAVATARRKRPDIVLMDIAMPGIDGLDTIKELQRELPESLYILSTAYERFDLAQRAIPLRVFSYLVKPVSRTRFLETLHQAREHLEAREGLLVARMEDAQSEAIERQRAERRLLLHIAARPIDTAAWERYRSVVRITSDYGIVAVIRTQNREHYQQIVRQIEHRHRCLSAEYVDHLIVLLPDPVQATGVQTALRDAVEAVTGPAGGAHVAIGTKQRYDAFHATCDELLGSEVRAAAVRRRREAVSTLRRHIARAQSSEQILAYCRSYFDEEFAATTFELAKAQMIGLFTLLVDDLAGRAGTQEAATRIGDPAAQIAQIRSRPEWDAWAERALDRIVAYRNDPIDAHWPAPLRQSVGYIAARYAEPLQLSSVAHYAQVSTGYLSRLFTEHMHTSFSDYLNRVRVSAAEALLAAGDLSIKEVAYAAGYRDPNYFSRIFKKITGVSPSVFYAAKEDDA